MSANPLESAVVNSRYALAIARASVGSIFMFRGWVIVSLPMMVFILFMLFILVAFMVLVMG